MVRSPVDHAHAEPETIQVTEATYKRLGHRYLLEPRGVIAVKGKGDMRTYLLIRRSSDGDGQS